MRILKALRSKHRTENRYINTYIYSVKSRH